MARLVLAGASLLMFCGAANAAQIAPARAGSPAIARDFWKPDRAVWGDGRDATPPSPQHIPQGFRNDYVIDVPVTGWYELYLVDAGDAFRHDLFIDGVLAWRFATTDKSGKAGNLWLEQGKRTLRIQRLGRVGFPCRAFTRLELRPADGRPEATISARKSGVDVMRVGESLRLSITGGGSNTASSYELLSTGLLPSVHGQQVVATVDFPASDTPIKRSIEIPCPAEGAFRVSARTSGKPLGVGDFQVGDYAVIDVHKSPAASGELEVVHEIDCVAQTIDGKPVTTFTECNGPTRITQSKAGRYRESHDCTPPQAPVPPTSVQEPMSFSGFSYRVDLPQAHVPYLVEVQYPDDARRSVTVTLNSLDAKTGGFLEGAGYSGKSFETGGMFPLSYGTCRHVAVTWPRSQSLLIGLLSQSNGQRAAAVRIRVMRFKDGRLPAGSAASADGGRAFVHWYEETRSWRHLVNATDLPQGVVQDFIGLDRWAQLARYYGANGLSGLGLGYQEVFHRTQILDGLMPSEYDASRLLALICEKYGMRYLPEVYNGQWYMESIDFPERAGGDDFRDVNCSGGNVGTGASPCTLDPLHPVVQDNWIAALGEMADKLRDSPAFAGITVRSDSWGFRGEFTYPSIYWGYSDWDIAQFQKDTGVSVPGATGDPNRFSTRFEFLNSEQMRARWIAWRNGRILNYHQRIRDRIRGDRKDLFFAIAGGFDADPMYRKADTFRERALGCGVDIVARQDIDGLAVIPTARYGARTTTVFDQANYDDFFNQELVHGGMGNPRAFAAYMNYHELAQYWPAAKLGITLPPGGKPPYYCSAILASGRNSLEKFAVVLAEQDSAILRDGGNTDIYGDPAIWNPWLAEFRSIPNVPFTQFPAAQDPVALWFRNIAGPDAASLKIEPGLYFYAVNREQYPLKIRVTLRKTARVTQLGSAKQLQLADGHLDLELAPYELKSLRAPEGASLEAAVTDVPAERIEYLRGRLAFAQELSGRLDTSLAGMLSETEIRNFRKNLADAWAAMGVGHYWRARVTLGAAPMMKVYAAGGQLPEGQVVTRFPGLMQAVSRAGHWNLIEPMLRAEKLAVRSVSQQAAQLVSSTALNPEWSGWQVQVADAGLEIDLEAPAEGRYVLHVGHIARDAGVALAEVNGKSLPSPIVTRRPGSPETAVFPGTDLPAGKSTLRLARPGGIGIYAIKLLPALRPMGDASWAVAGPFPTECSIKEAFTDAAVKQSLEATYPPEQNPDLARVYDAGGGRKVAWAMPGAGIQSDVWDRGVDMPIRVQARKGEMNFAVTRIFSDRDRTALFYLATDWWARAYLNGERITTNIDPKLRDACGADFTTWYPTFWGTLHLKKGVNTLMVKQLGGSMGSCFSAYLTDDGGIRLALPSPGEKAGVRQ